MGTHTLSNSTFDLTSVTTLKYSNYNKTDVTMGGFYCDFFSFSI